MRRALSWVSWTVCHSEGHKRANHLRGLSYFKVVGSSKASFYCCRCLEDVESSYVAFKTKRPIQMLNRNAVAETKTGLFEGQTKSVLRLYTPPGLKIYCHNISGNISWKLVFVWKPLRWMSNHVEITRSAVMFRVSSGLQKPAEFAISPVELNVVFPKWSVEQWLKGKGFPMRSLK